MTDSPIPAVHADRRGVSLLMTMLLTLLLLVAITGATMRTSAERRSAMDGAATVEAFALAQSGLDRYLDGLTTPPSVLPDSQTFNLPGGRAVVTLRRFRAQGSDTLLVMTSRGELSSAQRYDPTAAMATRTVAQLVRYGAGSMDLPAALTVLGSLGQNGSSATYSGIDECSKESPIPGLSVPTDSFSVSGGGKGGGKKGGGGGGTTYAGIDGSPDNEPFDLGEMDEAIDAVEIDWQGIVDGSALPPSALVLQANGNKTPTGWPSMNISKKDSSWPLIVVDGGEQRLGPGLSGYGILVVTGDATFNGNFDWHGIVLVGGAVTGNGNNEVKGAMFAGLNAKLGSNVGPSSLSNGTKLVQYNSCYVASALSQFGGWQRMGNGWVDNWPSY